MRFNKIDCGVLKAPTVLLKSRFTNIRAADISKAATKSIQYTPHLKKPVDYGQRLQTTKASMACGKKQQNLRMAFSGQSQQPTSNQRYACLAAVVGPFLAPCSSASLLAPAVLTKKPVALGHNTQLIKKKVFVSTYGANIKVVGAADELKAIGRADNKKQNLSNGPEGHKTFYNYTFDKGRLKSLVSWSLKTYGEYKTIKLLENLKKTGFEYATKAGISLGIEDLKIPPKKALLLYEAEEISKKAIDQYNRCEITGVERFQRLIDTWHRTSEQLKQEVIDYFEKTDILNPVYMMAFSGARGNISQVRQLVGMRGLMADPKGQIIDYPIRSNFREGLTLTEYIISSYGARKGIVDTALRTANAGYLTRRLVDVAQHVVISNFDCGTTKGIFLSDMKEGNKTIYSLQSRLLGRVLARDILKYNNNNILDINALPDKNGDHRPQSNNQQYLAKRNQEITADLAFEITKYYKKVFVRSPLTCETKKLVCQLCYGWSLAQGNLVSIGEAVGIVAAQSIGEPGTQLTMRTFHTGGVFSGDISDQIRAPYNGFIHYCSSSYGILPDGIGSAQQNKDLSGNRPTDLENSKSNKTAIAGTLIRTPEGKMAFLTKTDGFVCVYNDSNSIATAKKWKIPAYTILYYQQGQAVCEKQVIAQISTIARQQNMRDDSELTVKSEIQGQFFIKTLQIQEQFIGPKQKKSATAKSKKKKNIEFNPLIMDQKLASWDWGYAWILSCKLSKIPIFSSQGTTKLSLIPKMGDFVDQNSILTQIQWFLPQHGAERIGYSFSSLQLMAEGHKKLYLQKGSKKSSTGASASVGDIPLVASFSNQKKAKATLFNSINIQKNLLSLDINKIYYKKIGYFLDNPQFLIFVPNNLKGIIVPTYARMHNSFFNMSDFNKAPKQFTPPNIQIFTKKANLLPFSSQSNKMCKGLLSTAIWAQCSGSLQSRPQALLTGNLNKAANKKSQNSKSKGLAQKDLSSALLAPTALTKKPTTNNIFSFNLPNMSCVAAERLSFSSLQVEKQKQQKSLFWDYANLIKDFRLGQRTKVINQRTYITFKSLLKKHPQSATFAHVNKAIILHQDAKQKPTGLANKKGHKYFLQTSKSTFSNLNGVASSMQIINLSIAKGYTQTNYLHKAQDQLSTPSLYAAKPYIYSGVFPIGVRSFASLANAKRVPMRNNMLKRSTEVGSTSKKANITPEVPKILIFPGFGQHAWQLWRGAPNKNGMLSSLASKTSKEKMAAFKMKPYKHKSVINSKTANPTYNLLFNFQKKQVIAFNSGLAEYYKHSLMVQKVCTFKSPTYHFNAGIKDIFAELEQLYYPSNNKETVAYDGDTLLFLSAEPTTNIYKNFYFPKYSTGGALCIKCPNVFLQKYVLSIPKQIEKADSSLVAYFGCGVASFFKGHGDIAKPAVYHTAQPFRKAERFSSSTKLSDSFSVSAVGANKALKWYINPNPRFLPSEFKKYLPCVDAWHRSFCFSTVGAKTKIKRSANTSSTVASVASKLPSIAVAKNKASGFFVSTGGYGLVSTGGANKKRQEKVNSGIIGLARQSLYLPRNTGVRVYDGIVCTHNIDSHFKSIDAFKTIKQSSLKMSTASGHFRIANIFYKKNNLGIFLNKNINCFSAEPSYGQRPYSTTIGAKNKTHKYAKPTIISCKRPQTFFKNEKSYFVNKQNISLNPLSKTPNATLITLSSNNNTQLSRPKVKLVATQNRQKQDRNAYLASSTLNQHIATSGHSPQLNATQLGKNKLAANSFKYSTGGAPMQPFGFHSKYILTFSMPNVFYGPINNKGQKEYDLGSVGIKEINKAHKFQNININLTHTHNSNLLFSRYATTTVKFLNPILLNLTFNNSLWKLDLKNTLADALFDNSRAKASKHHRGLIHTYKPIVSTVAQSNNNASGESKALVFSLKAILLGLLKQVCFEFNIIFKLKNYKFGLTKQPLILASGASRQRLGYDFLSTGDNSVIQYGTIDSKSMVKTQNQNIIQPTNAPTVQYGRRPSETSNKTQNPSLFLAPEVLNSNAEPTTVGCGVWPPAIARLRRQVYFKSDLLANSFTPDGPICGPNRSRYGIVPPPSFSQTIISSSQRHPAYGHNKVHKKAKTTFKICFENISYALNSLASTSFLSSYTGEILGSYGYAVKDTLSYDYASQPSTHYGFDSLDANAWGHSGIEVMGLGHSALPGHKKSLLFSNFIDKNQENLRSISYLQKQKILNNKNRCFVLTTKDLLSYKLDVRWPYSSSKTVDKALNIAPPVLKVNKPLTDSGDKLNSGLRPQSTVGAFKSNLGGFLKAPAVLLKKADWRTSAQSLQLLSTAPTERMSMADHKKTLIQKGKSNSYNLNRLLFNYVYKTAEASRQSSIKHLAFDYNLHLSKTDKQENNLVPLTEKKNLKIGAFVLRGTIAQKMPSIDTKPINKFKVFNLPGQIIHLSAKPSYASKASNTNEMLSGTLKAAEHKVTIRKAQPFFVSDKTTFHAFHGDFVQSKEPIITLIYQKLKSGDIIQGIPKVEQFFEARTTKRGRLFRDNLPNLLKGLFLKYYFYYFKLLKQGFGFLASAVSEGHKQEKVSSAVIVVDGKADNNKNKYALCAEAKQEFGYIAPKATPFKSSSAISNPQLKTKAVNLDYSYMASQWAVKQSFYKIQQIAVDGVLRVYRSQGVTISDKHLEIVVKQMTTKVRIIKSGQTAFFPGEIVDLDFVETLNTVLIRKIHYEPIILGITKASLQVDSFLSSASFQQTSKILSQAALTNKKDYLKGVKENVILGNLIPAGTGYLVSLEKVKFY